MKAAVKISRPPCPGYRSIFRLLSALISRVLALSTPAPTPRAPLMRLPERLAAARAAASPVRVSDYSGGGLPRWRRRGASRCGCRIRPHAARSFRGPRARELARRVCLRHGGSPLRSAFIGTAARSVAQFEVARVWRNLRARPAAAHPVTECGIGAGGARSRAWRLSASGGPASAAPSPSRLHAAAAPSPPSLDATGRSAD